MFAGGGAGKLCGFPLAHGGGGEAGGRSCYHGDGLRHIVGTATAGRHGVRHGVGACRSVGVADGFARSGAAIAEVPVVLGEMLTGDSGGAGEFGGVACANGGRGEAGYRNRKYDKRSLGAVGFATHGDGAGVGAHVRHRAVRDGGVL